MSEKPIPFNFVLDYLYPLEVITKPMFGLTAIYIQDKIVMGLRESPKHAESNGIWIATSREHHESLKKLLPSLSSIAVLGSNETGWQLLSSADDCFEEQAVIACELIKNNDARIGKIPKPKKKKTLKWKR
jgi:hypothetical protein